jgi:hypothetical protein
VPSPPPSGLPRGPIWSQDQTNLESHAESTPRRADPPSNRSLTPRIGTSPLSCRRRCGRPPGPRSQPAKARPISARTRGRVERGPVPRNATFRPPGQRSPRRSREPNKPEKVPPNNVSVRQPPGSSGRRERRQRAPPSARPRGDRAVGNPGTGMGQTPRRSCHVPGIAPVASTERWRGRRRPGFARPACPAIRADVICPRPSPSAPRRTTRAPRRAVPHP